MLHQSGEYKKMSSALLVRLLLQLGMLCLFSSLHATVYAQMPCSFPSYLTVRDRWETNISAERSVIGGFWIFTQQTVTAMNLRKSTSVLYTCQVSLSSDKFLVSYPADSNSTTLNYQCLQFTALSPNVVQLARSNTTSYLTPALCDDTQLTLDDSPLVWPLLDGPTAIPAILTGGFEFSLTDQSSGQLLCAITTLRPMWEGDCMQGDGINIDFRQFLCRDDLSMAIVQTLYTLGAWAQDGYIYAVVTNFDNLWPKLWMLRAPQMPPNPDSFDVDIFTSISTATPVVSSSPTPTWYTLHLTRSFFPTLCENEADECDECSSGFSSLYCQRNCSGLACSSLVSQTACNFDSATQGAWQQVSYTGTSLVNVIGTHLVVGAELPLTCLGLSVADSLDGVERRAVSMVFTNGCRPRLSCVGFIRQSAGVLQIQQSDVTIWPQPLPLDATNICATQEFADPPPSVLQSDLHPYAWRTLVADTESQPSVNCGLDGKLYLLVYRSTGAACTAYIDSCKGNPTTFDYVEDAQCGSPTLPPTHTCLASFTDNSTGDLSIITRAALTNSLGVDPVYTCWFVQQGTWDAAPRLYITNASDCQSQIANDILYRNFSGYFAQCDISLGPGPLGSYDCSATRDSSFQLTTNGVQGPTKKWIAPTPGVPVAPAVGVSIRGVPNVAMLLGVVAFHWMVGRVHLAT